MASTAVVSHPQLFACKCLNVRLKSAPTESASPDSNDTGFSKVHVGEDGIQVAHPQLTLRVKSRGETVPGTARCSRFTTLTCLICDLPVYRVHQVISSEVEAKDLPLLPSDDWAEHEIMKSPNGWIEIHKDCLSGEAIVQIASSEEYSSLFSLVLPPPPEKTPTSPTTWISPESTASSTPTPVIPESYLSQLPPLLPPPPFTPSHPAFLHILSVAEQDSQNIRAAANQELARIVRAKAAEVEEKEAELKAQLEQLWLKFKRGIEKIQQERPHAPSSTAPWSSPVKTNDHRSNGVKAPVAIPGFNPISATAPPRTTPPPPRKSWLSHSLAESSHLHQAMVDRTSHANSSEGASVRSESPTLVPNSANEREITSVLQFRRRIDDTINTAASYRYFLNIEEEMARHKKERPSEVASDHDETMGMPGPSQLTANGRNSQSSATAGGTNGNIKGKDKEEKEGKKESKSKSKHVHFVQTPAKETREPTSKRSQGSSKSDSGEMVFDLDYDVVGAEATSGEVQALLPLLDPPAAYQRARRTKPQHTAGLPASFSALRPASLPAPSHIRSGGPPDREVYSNNIMLSLPRSSGPVSKVNGRDKDKEDTTDQDTSEDTTDSSPRPTSDSDTDSEDYGEYHHHSQIGFHGSLPVNIVSRVRPREVLSLTSYQQKPTVERSQQALGTAPTGSAGTVPSKKVTASVTRKTTYAERDRSRLLDPGNLDFVVEVDEEDEGQKDRKAVSQSADGERGRHHAFKILQARAELPEEGMWRSLAS